MVIKADSKYKLKRLVKKLDSIKGRGTELITVYCPEDYDLNEIVSQLREEEAEAGNIKSKRTRKNVQSALSKMIEHLKEFSRTPDNGLAIFCGNVSEREGKTKIKLWDIEPFEPIQIKLYRCGKRFRLGPLKEMLEEGEEYGLLVIDTSGADMGVLKGKTVVPKQHISSMVPGKSKPGGQSAQRYERVREGILDNYLQKVGDIANKIFDVEELKGIIVGGPGPIKEGFVKDDYLSKKIKDNILAVKSTSYTGEQGFQELLEKSKDLLRETEMQEERELVKELFERLREDGKVAYGIDHVMKSIELGAAEKILISEDYDVEYVEYECDCGEKGSEILGKDEEMECTECEREPEITKEVDIVDYLEKQVKNVGGEVEIISTDTSEGEQFYKLGGVAALLRFRIQ